MSRKTCELCGVEKHVSQFPQLKGDIRSRATSCKQCLAAHMRTYAEESLQAGFRQHREFNRRADKLERRTT